jgi:hypothetical protein
MKFVGGDILVFVSPLAGAQVRTTSSGVYTAHKTPKFGGTVPICGGCRPPLGQRLVSHLILSGDFLCAED